MIDGVIIKQLVTHTDERGYFREVIRSTDNFFDKGFGQWSHSLMNTGVCKAWHIHSSQYDFFYCPIGAIKVALCDLRNTDIPALIKEAHSSRPGIDYKFTIEEFILGDQHPAQVIRIPPGVAHGLKVLQGPAHLFYITSKVYDPEDEGRIPYDALGYDWFKQEIK